jgi:glycine cleavage system H protein
VLYPKENCAELDVGLAIKPIVPLNPIPEVTFPSKTKDHEWISIDGDIATVGITDFAQSELGDIVYVEVETLDQTLEKDEVFGTVEAVKTVSDLFLPLAGEIIEFNEDLERNPEVVNSDPYGKGWMIKVKISDDSQISELLDSEAYGKLIGA